LHPCVAAPMSPIGEVEAGVAVWSRFFYFKIGQFRPGFSEPVGTGPVRPVPSPTGPARFEK
jgi:hypothetical protein